MNTLNSAKKVKLGGRGDVRLIKLNGAIIYRFNSFYVEYTVASSSNNILFSLPFFGVREGDEIVYSIDNYDWDFYKKLRITLTDGKVIDGTILDGSAYDLANITCDMVKKVKAYYPDGIVGLRFKYSGESSDPKIKTLEYSNLTSLEHFSFEDCSSLETIPSSTVIDTSSFTTMKKMFYRCESLTSLDVSGFKTSKVTDMSYMFRECKSLTELNLSNWNTSSTKYMSCMFYDCENLTTVGDISNWDTSNVTNMIYMFEGCKSLTELNLSNWDVSNVIHMDYMFHTLIGSSGIQYIDLSNWNINNEADTFGMFSHCLLLSTLRLDNCNYDTIKKIITSSSFPTGPAIGAEKRIIYCKRANVQKEGAEKLVPPTNWVFKYVDIDGEPEELPPETPVIPEEPGETEEQIPLYKYGQFTDDATITEVKIMVNESHTNLGGMFDDCTALTTVNTTDWDTSNVKYMNYMFNNCYSLTSLDVSNWDTGNVTDMGHMFSGCSLETIRGIGNFDTSSVTKMGYMFGGCSQLKLLQFSGWDTSNVTSMSNMFNGCYSLVAPYLENWDVGNVTTMFCMFRDCLALTSLDLSGWIPSNVSTIEGMFERCSQLAEINLSNFNFESLSADGTRDMFNGCTSLREIRLDNCDYYTIDKIINSEGFPTGDIEGVKTRKIYVKQANATGLTEPGGWKFEYVD